MRIRCSCDADFVVETIVRAEVFQNFLNGHLNSEAWFVLFQLWPLPSVVLPLLWRALESRCTTSWLAAHWYVTMCHCSDVTNVLLVFIRCHRVTSIVFTLCRRVMSEP